MAQNRYSEATWETGQLDIRLGVSQAEEANAARARLTESDAAVAGTMSLRNAFILISTIFILIALPLL